MISEAAKFFIGRCFNGEVVMAIHPLFDEKYEFNNKTYKFTREVLEEMLKTNRVKASYIGKKSCNIIGIEGMDEKEEK